MTNSLTDMIRLLRPLGLYSLEGGTLVDAELAAYGAGFALVEAQLGALERECFLQTAEDYGLSLREAAMQLFLRPQNTVEKRRELLLYRLAVAPNDYNFAGMTGSVRAAGLNAQIVEDIANERIRIVEDGYIGNFEDMDAVKEEVRRMLPAHLEADFEIGTLTWDIFDAADLTWTSFEAKDATWNQLDLDGAGVLEGDY